MKRTILAAIGLLALALAWAALAETVEKELPAEPGGTLEINLSSGGDVTVTGWDRDAVGVEARIGGRDAEDLEIESTGRGVRIKSSASRSWGGRESSVDLAVKVPRRYDLELETMGGDLEVRGVEGEVSGRTMGGDLELHQLKGELKLTTMGGDIRLEDSDVDGSLSTMGGEVVLQDVVGDIEGKSMGGDVIYRNVARRDGSSTGKVVKISTMGGDVEAGDAPAGADLHTMGGDIELASAKEFAKVKTMGGDIELGAVDGWIEATTMGGDVRARMVGDPARGDRHVELTSMGGEISLTVPAGLSMEIDVELAYTKGESGKYRIDSDFPLEIEESDTWEGKWGTPRKVIRGTATVGGGEHKVKIRTINGNVYLKKG